MCVIRVSMYTCPGQQLRFDIKPFSTQKQNVHCIACVFQDNPPAGNQCESRSRILMWTESREAQVDPPAAPFSSASVCRCVCIRWRTWILWDMSMRPCSHKTYFSHRPFVHGHFVQRCVQAQREPNGLPWMLCGKGFWGHQRSYIWEWFLQGATVAF